MGFMDELKKAIDENTFCYTENGAKMYAGTGNALLDLNYAVSSLRNASIGEVIEKLVKAPFTLSKRRVSAKNGSGGI